ncbi:MAG: hypothetical protein LBD51_00810 [Bifidobacteriaceae bacterium]|jgi:uncharacterized membrane protein YphA (DoxX/SURF4 family)|nr:hypothetical protein [Bifidobacteriaceae bacterium]
MSIVRIKARALIGAAVIADGVDVLRQPAPHEQVAAPLVAAVGRALGQELQASQVVRASAIAQTVGGSLIASSIAPRLGALASLAATVPAALFGYRFWAVDDADQRAWLRRGFFAHLALAGAALLVLAGPTRRAGRRACRRAKAAGGAKSAL